MTESSMSSYFAAVTAFIFEEAAPVPADIILVPGSRDPEPAERAAELFHAGYAPFILPSGHFTKEVGRFLGVRADAADRYPSDYATEWELQRDILLRHGVPDSAILKEDSATYTWENAQLSRRVCEKLHLTIHRALLACKPFHARRAALYYKAAFPETEILCCPCRFPGLERDSWMETAHGRQMVLGEVRRLGDQVNEVVEDALTASLCRR